MSTVRVHGLFAEIALAARCDAGDQHLIAGPKVGNAGSDTLDDTNAFVSENAAVGDRRQVSL